MNTLEKYPLFCYKHSFITDGRIILLDELIREETLSELRKLKTIDNQELIFLEDSQLAADMEIILLEIIEQKQDILFVFPGNGANFPRKLSKICQKFSGVSILAKRIWEPGTDPIVEVGFIEREVKYILPVKTIVVVDDVISSGLTMQKVHENNVWKFPGAKWIAVSWISQIPRMKAKSGIIGFENVNTACMVKKTNGGRVPINSLSTLRQQKDISENYVHRHYKEPKKFLELISLGYSTR